MKTELSKREINMLRTFLTKTRFWRGMPQTAIDLWDSGFIKPTRFGMGNFQITDKGRLYLKSIPENSSE